MLAKAFIFVTTLATFHSYFSLDRFCFVRRFVKVRRSKFNVDCDAMSV